MWLGCSTPISHSGLKLKDNGICLVNEEKIVLAISEERLSRIKHDNNLYYLSKLFADKFSHINIEALGVSSCSDTPWIDKIIPYPFNGIRKIYLPSHHFSHALSTFHLSEYNTSLILVADAGGNSFSNLPSRNWWALPREQTSLFYGDGNDIHLLKRIHFEPFEIGYGEFYRAITHYLGWNSHTLSGNTMALSSYGFAEEISNQNIWDILDSSNHSILNDPQNPLEMVQRFLKYIGITNIPPRLNGVTLNQDHKNLAAYVQKSIENSISKLIEDAIKSFGEKNICLSGGVAQNCVMNAKLATKSFVNSIYISPFSGDVGQCVGNALYARNLSSSQLPKIKLSSLFLGIEYSEEDIINSIAKKSVKYSIINDNELAQIIAQLLSELKVIAIYRGRSEFGPRALGNRSVLGDPIDFATTLRIKRAVKCRDEFMPLAPVINIELANELRPKIPLSNTMVFAPEVPAEKQKEFGYSLHTDKTARIQVADVNSFIDLIIRSFYKITNRRVLINTSFNKRGMPIVETPSDAIEAFSELDIDALVINNYLITKNV